MGRRPQKDDNFDTNGQGDGRGPPTQGEHGRSGTVVHISPHTASLGCAKGQGGGMSLHNKSLTGESREELVNKEEAGCVLGSKG